MAPSARKTGRSRSPRRRNGTPPRWPTVRQVGWICAAAQGIEVKDRGQVPAELGGQVQAATGKTLCGEGSPGSAFSTPSCRIARVARTHTHALLDIFHRSLMGPDDRQLDCVTPLSGQALPAMRGRESELR